MGRERRKRTSAERKKRREEKRRWAAASFPPAQVPAGRREEGRWEDRGKKSQYPLPPHRPTDSLTPSPTLQGDLRAQKKLKKKQFPRSDTAVNYPTKSSQTPPQESTVSSPPHRAMCPSLSLSQTSASPRNPIDTFLCWYQVCCTAYVGQDTCLLWDTSLFSTYFTWRRIC